VPIWGIANQPLWPTQPMRAVQPHCPFLIRSPPRRCSQFANGSPSEHSHYFFCASSSQPYQSDSTLRKCHATVKTNVLRFLQLHIGTLRSFGRNNTSNNTQLYERQPQSLQFPKTSQAFICCPNKAQCHLQRATHDALQRSVLSGFRRHPFAWPWWERDFPGPLTSLNSTPT
jgi:hypothetical protein